MPGAVLGWFFLIFVKDRVGHKCASNLEVDDEMSLSVEEINCVWDSEGDVFIHTA